MLSGNFCIVQIQYHYSDWRSNTVVKCPNAFHYQIFMAGNSSSLFTAAVSKKDKGKNQAKVDKRKTKSAAINHSNN